jgi:hypothetical protein
MAKEMCKLAKDEFHLKKSKQFAKLVREPKFVCKKCGRVANKKICLCKPVELE